jgi:hypothetical protein
MSALCQKRTSRHLLDQLVGAREDRFGDCQTKGLCRSQINDQIKLGWLFDGDITRLRPTQDLVDIIGSASK